MHKSDTRRTVTKVEDFNGLQLFVAKKEPDSTLDKDECKATSRSSFAILERRGGKELVKMSLKE